MCPTESGAGKVLGQSMHPLSSMIEEVVSIYFDTVLACCRSDAVPVHLLAIPGLPVGCKDICEACGYIG